MQVDDYKYLPRSFRTLYEDEPPIDEGVVWSTFDKRLSDSKISLLSSAGLHLAHQPPFDIERERREPTWGDASFRRIPHAGKVGDLAISHLHVNDVNILRDPSIALPMSPLEDLVRDDVVGEASDTHFSVMGYQGWSERALDRWRDDTAPAISESLKRSETDGVVLAPV